MYNFSVNSFVLYLQTMLSSVRQLLSRPLHLARPAVAASQYSSFPDGANFYQMVELFFDRATSLMEDRLVEQVKV